MFLFSLNCEQSVAKVKISVYCKSQLNDNAVIKKRQRCHLSASYHNENIK